VIKTFIQFHVNSHSDQPQYIIIQLIFTIHQHHQHNDSLVFTIHSYSPSFIIHYNSPAFTMHNIAIQLISTIHKSKKGLFVLEIFFA